MGSQLHQQKPLGLHCKTSITWHILSLLWIWSLGLISCQPSMDNKAESHGKYVYCSIASAGGERIRERWQDSQRPYQSCSYRVVFFPSHGSVGSTSGPGPLPINLALCVCVRITNFLFSITVMEAAICPQNTQMFFILGGREYGVSAVTLSHHTMVHRNS